MGLIEKVAYVAECEDCASEWDDGDSPAHTVSDAIDDAVGDGWWWDEDSDSPWFRCPDCFRCEECESSDAFLAEGRMVCDEHEYHDFNGYCDASCCNEDDEDDDEDEGDEGERQGGNRTPSVAPAPTSARPFVADDEDSGITEAQKAFALAQLRRQGVGA